MARFFHPDAFRSFRKNGYGFLAFWWISGLILGILLFLRTGADIASLMNTALSSPVSIVGALVPFILPFLFSAAAVYLSAFWLLIPICFLKAVFFSFFGCVFEMCFDTGGWLAHGLFFLHSSIYIGLLFYYWARYFPGDRKFSLREACTLLAIAVAVAWGYVNYIAPFYRGVLLF